MGQRIIAFAPLIALLIVLATISAYIYRGMDAGTSSAGAVKLTPFQLATRDGERITFTPAPESAPPVRVVNFFASWCAPCKREHPQLTRLGRVEGVRMIGINHRMDPKLDRFLDSYGNPFDVIYKDNEGAAAMTFGISGLPETFLIAPDGDIIYHKAGAVTPELLRRKILPLVKDRDGGNR